MPGSTPPRPDDWSRGRALSNQERDIFDDITRRLGDDDPAFAPKPAWWRGHRALTIASVLAIVVGTALLSGGLVISEAWLAFVGFCIVLVGAVVRPTTPTRPGILRRLASGVRALFTRVLGGP